MYKEYVYDNGVETMEYITTEDIKRIKCSIIKYYIMSQILSVFKCFSSLRLLYKFFNDEIITIYSQKDTSSYNLGCYVVLFKNEKGILIYNLDCGKLVLEEANKDDWVYKGGAKKIYETDDKGVRKLIYSIYK